MTADTPAGMDEVNDLNAEINTEPRAKSDMVEIRREVDRQAKLARRAKQAEAEKAREAPRPGHRGRGACDRK